MLTLALKVDNLAFPKFVSSAAHAGPAVTAGSRSPFMSSRFLIPVLCVGAVVYACGPRTRSDASGGAKTRASVAQAVSTPGARNASRKSASQTPTFDARLTVNADPSAVQLSLHVVNTSARRVEVSFPTGQMYDFVILDSIGREVWHWGSTRMFTQSLRNRLLDGGEAFDVRETWHAGGLAPGRYTARGMLTSQNFPLTQTTEFVVGATASVASRDDP